MQLTTVAGPSRVEAIMHLGAVPSPSDHPRLRARREAEGQPQPRSTRRCTRTSWAPTYLLMAAVEAGVRTVVMTG